MASSDLELVRAVRGGDDAGDVRTALGQLEPDRRAVLVLRFCFDYDLAQIAEVLDVPGARRRPPLAPEAPRPASTPHETSVQTVGALRGLREAPRAQRLPGWVAQAYRDAQGRDAQAGPALLSSRPRDPTTRRSMPGRPARAT